jgi:hypothetical protein
MRTTNKCFKASLGLICGCLLLLTLPVPAYSNGFALLVKNSVNLGGNITVDSFNSQDPNYSSNGLYVLSKHEAHGDILTSASSVVFTTNFLSGAHIFGHVYLGPNGVSKYAANSTIGDTNFVGPGIEPGWSSSIGNFQILDAPALPSVSWQPMPAPVGISYTITGSGPGTITYVRIPSSFGNLSGPATITITNGPVYLDIESSFQMSGSSALIVAPDASLKAWINGNNLQVSSIGIVNQTGNATNVVIYGTPNCTQIQYGGSSAFIGSLNAPYAYVNLSGSAAIYGAVVANSFDGSGGVSIHFDESLATSTSSPIWIGAQSGNQAVPLGSNVTFNVSIAGGSPTGFQWFFQPTNGFASMIAGGTNASLSLTNIQLSDAGNYSVVVSNLISAAYSVPAILFVYTNTAQLAAQFGPPAGSTNGQFQCNVAGVAGFNYAIQASTNLVDWIPLVTNVSPFNFTETNAGGDSRRFYRSIYLP